MYIRDMKDAAAWYMLLHYAAEQERKGFFPTDREKSEQNRREIKKALREYRDRRQNEIDFGAQVIHEDDFGYYTTLEALPAWIETEQDAEEYFEDALRLVYVPSMYDCTGQHFTRGHKLVNRRGRWYVYHFIAVDI